MSHLLSEFSDYAFNGAVRDGFLVQGDTDIQALKQILTTLAPINNITLNGNGLPKNNNTITAAKAFEILAADSTAITHINNIHKKLLTQNIWIWKSGAIEAHIGTQSKDEKSWSKFKLDVEINGLQATCADYSSIESMINWLRS